MTTMQREVPSEILSRVSAYDWFGSLVFLPIGTALVGPIAHVCGLRATIVGATVLLVIFIGGTLLVPSVCPHERSRQAGLLSSVTPHFLEENRDVSAILGS